MLLPLVNRSSGGGGISPTPEDKVYLYKNGVWNIPYDNTSRTWSSGDTSNGFTLESDKMVSVAYSIISTATAYDLSNIAYIHMKCKFNGTNTNNGFRVCSSREITTNIRSCTVDQKGIVTDYILDVRDVTSAYILIYMYQANSEIYELYLVPKKRIYLIKDGQLQDNFTLSPTGYNASGYNSSNRPTITYNSDHVNVAITLKFAWTDSCCSVIGTTTFTPQASDILHIKAAVTNYPATEHGYSLDLGQINKYGNQYTIQASTPLYSTGANIVDFNFKLANSNPWFCLPNVSECNVGGANLLNVKIYDMYLN